MHHNCSDTAILLFIRTAHEEARAKDLCPRAGYQQKLGLVRVMNNHAQKIACQTPFPTFVFSGDAQCGVTFGEKLSHAIQSVFQKGFQRVITIGNDCFELNPQHLRLAAEQLKHHPLVIGPAKDGGTYLIGIKRDIFDTRAMLAFPWHGKKLLEAFISWADKHQISTFFLPEYEDADSAAVFKSILKHLAYTPFKHQILGVLGLLVTPLHTRLIPMIRSLFTAMLFQRGPPALFFFANI
jgi:glycosyltransferase A (GT-A) superfamily protein (DUF2064 family)